MAFGLTPLLRGGKSKKRLEEDIPYRFFDFCKLFLIENIHLFRKAFYIK